MPWLWERPPKSWRSEARGIFYGEIPRLGNLWDICVFVLYIWLVVSNMNGLLSISYMGCHPSHWRSPSFFNMVSLNHQPDIFSHIFPYFPHGLPIKNGDVFHGYVRNNQMVFPVPLKFPLDPIKPPEYPIKPPFFNMVKTTNQVLFLGVSFCSKSKKRRLWTDRWTQKTTSDGNQLTWEDWENWQILTKID